MNNDIIREWREHWYNDGAGEDEEGPTFKLYFISVYIMVLFMVIILMWIKTNL